MRHPSALDHPRALQIDRPSAEVVEQSDAAPEQNGHQVDEVARELPKLLEACRKAVEMEPKSARLHARYARVLAIGGGATEVMLEEVAKRFAPD